MVCCPVILVSLIDILLRLITMDVNTVNSEFLVHEHQVSVNDNEPHQRL